VIDLFAGPGGLGEGFSSLVRRGERAYRIKLSVEKDLFAHRTLRLRSFFRRFSVNKVPSEYYAALRGTITEKQLFDQFPGPATEAGEEAICATLGGSDLSHSELDAKIADLVGKSKAWVLIGGPPCQAYSVAGRSRNKGIEGYRLEDDGRHRLYEEYLRIVARHWPSVFVMENVKGLLSTTVRDKLLFEKMYEDLRDPGRTLGLKSGKRYRVLSLEESAEQPLFDGASLGRFVVCAERHGVPQCRHRVILLGVREDIGQLALRALPIRPPVWAGRVLEGLPPLRSGVSRRVEPGGKTRAVDDSRDVWLDALADGRNRRWVDGNRSVENQRQVRNLIVRTLDRLSAPPSDRGAEFVPWPVTIDYEPEWYLDEGIGGACNHSSRTHMDRDLHRYVFSACFASVNGRSPRLWDFPPDLLPEHQNVDQALNGGFFNDRFRVQLAIAPATTITSHIHKDGHYYIHPDPAQCRSLTVREAARLQTFPDNYFFMGPRTEQYKQVGNAVPPLLAREIAGVVLDLLLRSGLVG
jgi:DNA (cytosine-5)-methyltransferase 1